MCFGGGSSDNSEAINLQKEEARAARKKDEERKANIKKGIAAIKAKFEGYDPMKKGPTKSFDWSKFKDPTSEQVQDIYGGTTTAVSGLPAGYTYQQLPDGRWTVRHGKDIFQPGQAISYNEMLPTGKKIGGIPKDFFTDFRNAITSYYVPQVTEQYGDANEELNYRLARAGLGQSSAANDERADLVKQNKLNVLGIRNKADTAEGDLKERTNQTKQALIDQVYAGEDPGIAADAATARVNTLTATEPDLSPLAAVFNLAAVGTAGALKQYNNERYRSQVPGYNASGATRIV